MNDSEAFVDLLVARLELHFVGMDISNTGFFVPMSCIAASRTRTCPLLVIQALSITKFTPLLTLTVYVCAKMQCRLNATSAIFLSRNRYNVNAKFKKSGRSRGMWMPNGHFQHYGAKTSTSAYYRWKACSIAHCPL